MLSLGTVLAVAATCAAPGANAQAPQPKPAPLPSGTVIVKVLPGAAQTDGDYVIDEGMSVTPHKTADEKYAEMKAALDERFERMFELKNEIDKHNQQANAYWEEYYALRDAYEKQLKKIIADWVTEQNYL